MSKLLDELSTSETEILAALSPLYAEVQHWEAELGLVRKAKRAIAMETQRAETENTGSVAKP
jgi:hypothetical protein